MDDPSMQNMQELRNQYMEQQRQQREQQEQLLQQQRMQQQQAAMQRQQQAMFQQQVAAQRQQGMVGGGFGLGSLFGGGALTGMFTGGAYRGGPQSLAQLSTRGAAAASADFLGSLGMGGLGRYLFGNMGYSAQFGGMTADYALNRANLGYRQFFAGMMNTGAGRLLSFGLGDDFALSQSRLQRQQFTEGVFRDVGGNALRALGARGEGNVLVDPNAEIFTRISAAQEQAIKAFTEERGLTVKDQDVQEMLQYSSSLATRSLQQRGVLRSGDSDLITQEMRDATGEFAETLQNFSESMNMTREEAVGVARELGGLRLTAEGTREAMDQIVAAREQGVSVAAVTGAQQIGAQLAAGQSLSSRAMIRNVEATRDFLKPLIEAATANNPTLQNQMAAFGGESSEQGMALGGKLVTAGPQNIRELLAYGRSKGVKLEGDLQSMMGQVMSDFDADDFLRFRIMDAEKVGDVDTTMDLIRGLRGATEGLGVGAALTVQQGVSGLDAGALRAISNLDLEGGGAAAVLSENTTATTSLTNSINKLADKIDGAQTDSKKVTVTDSGTNSPWASAATHLLKNTNTGRFISALGDLGLA